ncbi:MAG: competence/damage-inducible protein A [Bacteroidota bacterium]|nr:competence/damage-inducible protein A [Bacteroidota bacterium]
MRSKLISIGDEILIGQIVNTNAAYLGDKLFSIGIPVEKTVVIGDVESMLLSEFEDSIRNYDVTIITGGLGPTHDDITKPALTKFFNDELITDEKVLKHVKNIFSSRNLIMPVVNEAQALVPKNSKVIWNTNGTAPGIWIEKNNKIFIAMPGVPYEMKSMFDNEIIPGLNFFFTGKINSVLLQKTLLTTGLGESTLSSMLGDIKGLIGGSKLAFLPSATGVRLRINVEGENEKEAITKMYEIENRIRAKVEIYIYGVNDEELEKIIGDILRDRRQTLSVAESCTGGIISSRIVSVAGSSDYYAGGVCAYSNKEKFKLLNVGEETIKKYGAVSEQTATEMALGVRELMETDFAISTTGIAGPGGGSEKKPVGLMWIGFSSKEKTYAKDFLFGDNRQRNIQRASQRALEILRRELLNLEIKF